MGPSRYDPSKLIGTFNMSFLKEIPARRKEAMDTLRWMTGEWDHSNNVPATSESPAYSDAGRSKLVLCEKENWICRDLDGVLHPHITFDPFSGQFMYLLAEGAYGLLRSPGWGDDTLVFDGQMTMLGVDCTWRLTVTKISDDEFQYRNEEMMMDGEWAFIDEWRFTRARNPS